MRALILTALTNFVLLSSGAAATSAPGELGLADFNIAKMQAHLLRMRGTVNLPLGTQQIMQELPQLFLDQPVDAEVLNIFLQIERFVFGRNGVLQIKNCEGYAFSIGTDYNLKTIFVDPSFLEGRRKKYGTEFRTLIYFVLAHEISHFVAEASIENGRTINGYSSVYAPPDIEDRDGQLIPTAAMDSALGHAEVDVYALLILRKMRVQAPAVMLEELKVYLEQAGNLAVQNFRIVGVMGMEYRISVLNDGLKRLWKD